jgi:uncharacterized membrane protein YphA (DoxX/SURF4 family)
MKKSAQGSNVPGLLKCESTWHSQLHFILRISCAMCFIGHGVFGIITKKIWCNYFAVFGIGEDVAFQLMPLVGLLDIALGIMLIVYPIRAVAGWLIFWGLFTASLRPLSGEPFAEFMERAGNYGAPLVLLLLSGSESVKRLFQKIEPSKEIDRDQLQMVWTCLRVFGFMMLFGHGWLNLMEKQTLLKQYSNLGFSNPASIAQVTGAFEITGAFLVLIRPTKNIVLVFFIWKIVTELLHPAHGVFEWVERAGSYSILLSLWMILKSQPGLNNLFSIKFNAFSKNLFTT